MYKISISVSWGVPKLGTVSKRSCTNLADAFGAELTELRVGQGWSQQHLATMLGYNPNYIGSLERGEKSPTLRTLSDLAMAFEKSVSSIIRDAEERLARDRRRKRSDA